MKEFLVASERNGRPQHILDEIYRFNAELKMGDRFVKFCRMASVPLIFFRGTNHLFWADFAGDARLERFGNGKTGTWLQGDLHAYNFGSYHNDKGEVVYDLNDFDDALIADYQLDLWRMAVSLVLIARQSGHLSSGKQAAGIKAFVTAYLDGLADVGQGQPPYYTEKNTFGKLDNFLRQVEDEYNQAGMLKRWAHGKKGKRRFDLSRSKLDEVTPEERGKIEGALVDYRRTLTNDPAVSPDHFQVLDVAKRLLAGTGSLGRPRYYLLIAGNNGAENDGERILDIKLQQKPAGYTYLGQDEQARHDQMFDHEARRHAEAYRALTRHTDDYLGWMKLDGDYYSVRERSPFKESFPGEKLETKGAFKKLAKQWGLILAADHVRGNKKLSGSLAEEVGNLVKGNRKAFKALVRDVAFHYADQVEMDHQTFVEALALEPGECDEHAFKPPKYEKGSLLPS